MKKIAALALLLTALPLFAHAFTSPGKPTGFVNDFANVLTPEDKQSLEQQAQAVKDKTGAEIAIAIVPSLGSDETVETYAVSLFEDWQIGQKDLDNGVLLLIAMDTHDIKIETGYGAEGNLTDAQSKQIIDKIMVPAFRNNDFAGGLSAAIDAIGQTFATGEVPTTNTAPQKNASFYFNILPGIFVAVMVFAQLFISIMGRSKSWWLGGVLGGIGAVVLGFVFGFLYVGIIALAVLIPIGLWIDKTVSRQYADAAASGQKPWWLRGNSSGRGGRFGRFGGFGGGSSGGGFGGFGGGSSGGGGASGKW